MYNNYKLMFIGTGFSQTENSSPKAHKYCQIYIFGKFQEKTINKRIQDDNY